MIPIVLTERTISHAWNKELQAEEATATDTEVFVNPERIACWRAIGDAPEKYATHIRMADGWDLFVTEPPGLVDALVRRARNDLLAEQHNYHLGDR